MIEFYHCLQEPKKSFSHFPVEWEAPLQYHQIFPDFAGHSLDGLDEKEIPYKFQVNSGYTGFVRIHSKVEGEYDNFFSYLKEGNLKYSQSEIHSGNLNLKKTIFYDEPFSIERIYLSSIGFGHSSKPILSCVKRVGDFKVTDELSIKIFQHSSNLFDLDFSNHGKTYFEFSLNEKNDPSKKYITLIKESPLIFYDLDGIKNCFGDLVIKNDEGSFELEELLNLYVK